MCVWVHLLIDCFLCIFFIYTTILCFWETHCTLVIYNSKLNDCSFTQCIFNSLQSGVLTELFWLLHGWCHLKLMPSSHRFWAHRATMHQFTVLFKATYRGCMCVAIKCHQHFWQNERDLLGATATTQGWNRGDIFLPLLPNCRYIYIYIYIHRHDWIHWHCQWQDHFWHMYMQREEMRRAQLSKKYQMLKNGQSVSF